MEAIIGVIIFIAIVIYFLAKDSNKDSNKEKYVEAVGKLAQMTADGISNAAYTVTEPADKKRIRLAQNALASRHGRLYRTICYWDAQEKERLLEIDDYMRGMLGVLELSEDKCSMLGLMFYHLGAIRKLSRYAFDYSRKISKSEREYILADGGEDEIQRAQLEALEQALTFFSIRTPDWIEYGDAVIEMHNLFDHHDIRKYGFVDSIHPLSNNLHLL